MPIGAFFQTSRKRPGRVFANTRSFSYTGAIQTWVVPAGVTSINVNALGGAGGGTQYISSGGAGANVTADIAVTPGSTLYVMVGKQGNSPTGATFKTGGAACYGGGGAGGNCGAGPGNIGGAGGGGASGIFSSSSITRTNVLIIAGGGGGTPAWDQRGGNGGHPNGEGVGPYNSSGGASTSGPGTTSAPYDPNTTNPTAGAAGGLTGGNGGSATGNADWGGGGGGGGGYYGGAGGYGGGSIIGSGGGGSSWAAGGASLTYGARNSGANGSLTIRW